MNTQNVNVKTATKESSERWVKTSSLRTDGFVRNIHSRNPFDVIRADVVLARMEIQANRGCGLHYEIYESRLLGIPGWPATSRKATSGRAAFAACCLVKPRVS